MHALHLPPNIFSSTWSSFYYKFKTIYTLIFVLIPTSVRTHTCHLTPHRPQFAATFSKTYDIDQGFFRLPTHTRLLANLEIFLFHFLASSFLNGVGLCATCAHRWLSPPLKNFQRQSMSVGCFDYPPTAAAQFLWEYANIYKYIPIGIYYIFTRHTGMQMVSGRPYPRKGVKIPVANGRKQCMQEPVTPATIWKFPRRD